MIQIEYIETICFVMVKKMGIKNIELNTMDNWHQYVFRCYTEVLKEVRINQPVYLTRNGRGAYAIVDVEELDRLKATIQLLTKLEEGEQSAREKGWLTADEVEAALGL